MLERSDGYNDDDGDDHDAGIHDDHHVGLRLDPQVNRCLSN